MRNTSYFLGVSFPPPLYYILLPVKRYGRILPLAGYWGRALPKLTAALRHSSSWHCTTENITCKGQAKETVLEQKTTFSLRTASRSHRDYVGLRATLCLFRKKTSLIIHTRSKWCAYTNYKNTSIPKFGRMFCIKDLLCVLYLIVWIVILPLFLFCNWKVLCQCGPEYFVALCKQSNGLLLQTIN